MARTTTVVIALLVAAGLVVAILPAQEAARRPSVYGGASGEPADLAPAPAPDLMPVDAVPPPAALPPATRPPAKDSKVAQAGILGRNRRGGSLSSQLRTSGEAASQEYTPTPAETAEPAPTASSIYQPAEVSPPAGAIPMPSPSAAPAGIAPIIDAPGAALSQVPTAADPSASVTGSTHSVLKRTRTAAEEPMRVQAGPPPRVSISRPDSTSRPEAARNGPSSRRVAPPSARSAIGRGDSPGATTIDTRAITELAISGKSPALRVDVAGPPGVSVGKPAYYLVTLSNESDTAAQDVQLRVALPGFVTVTATEPTDGEALMHADASGQARLVWSLPEVAARGRQTLRLALVAGEGQAFDLGVEWACRPAVAKASIVVRQPQLQLSLAGPADMTFGDEKTFTLSLANPGTGDAEEVVIQLSAGNGRRQQIEVGALPAGQRKEVPVSIVAAEAGEMEIHAVATGEGGLSAEAAGKVMVRKAELAVIVEGPQLKYAGGEAAYAVTIQNTGNAPADNVQIAASLPPMAKYLDGVPGVTPGSGTLKWKLGTLAAGGEKSYEVKLQLNAAGENVFAVQAQAGAGVAASGEAITTVEAEADLKLVVNDPAGPIPTGELAVYQVQVMNRGSDAARQVKIVMQFSDGIEPVSFEGCEAKVVPGQVICQPLAELAAGEQVTIRVKARAERGGTHQFRIEVTSDESETRLVSEGTTKFFADSGRGSAANTAKKPSLVPPGGTFR